MSMMFLSMEARAHVGGGDGPACSRALREAEHLFEGRRTGDDSDWIVYFDAAELVGEGAHCFRDLRSPRTAQEFIARAEERADARIWFWHKDREAAVSGYAESWSWWSQFRNRLPMGAAAS
jgi:hypothetical protein